MIFLDTSAIYALADRSDPNHDLGKMRFKRAVETGERILTHNYVLVESMALIQHRLGLEAALKLQENSSEFEIAWIDEKLHREASRSLRKSGRRAVSFVDHVSFLVMKSRGLDTVFAFDPHFEQEGFRIYGA